MNKIALLEKLEAEKHMALFLEKAIEEVGGKITEQANLINKGATRLSWYSSCFMKNHQDVCANLKYEDYRFLLALREIIKRNNVIYDMVKIYVDGLLRNLSDERIYRVQQIIIKFSADFTSTSLTNKSFGSAVTMAVCYSFGTKVAIYRKFNSITVKGFALTGAYGYVQIAAEAARKLRLTHPLYFYAHHNENIEMLYFLIEPVIGRSISNSHSVKADEEIASMIRGLMNL